MGHVRTEFTQEVYVKDYRHIVYSPGPQFEDLVNELLEKKTISSTSDFPLIKNETIDILLEEEFSDNK